MNAWIISCAVLAIVVILLWWLTPYDEAAPFLPPEMDE